MANVLFSRTSDPSSKPITDGQLIFDTSGNGKMYLDVGSERMEMGGARTVDPVLNSSSENPIQNKAVAGVMLDNMTDVNAVTGSGFLPDALAIKELDTDLQGQINTLNSNLIGKMNKYANTTFTSTSDLSDEKISKLDTGVYILRCQSVHSDFKDTDGISIWGFGTLTVSGVLNGYKSYLYIDAKGGLHIRHLGYDTWHTGWIKVK